MLEWIRCTNCNTEIGSIYGLFTEMRRHYISEQLKKIKSSNKNLQLDNDLNQDLTEIYELLHIERACCRTRLNQVVQFDSLLYNNYNE